MLLVVVLSPRFDRRPRIGGTQNLVRERIARWAVSRSDELTIFRPDLSKTGPQRHSLIAHPRFGRDLYFWKRLLLTGPICRTIAF